ncbi:MAG TPA: hypothetical protein VJI97_02870 [Candidatus Nanoarchaeia archaeon]|nr:hypothetical protein [Candidatus Nanoarchaeia archaeon]
MNAKTKRILLFVVVVIVVALLIKFVFSILSSLSWIVVLIAAVIVYLNWSKIKKMF